MVYRVPFCTKRNEIVSMGTEGTGEKVGIVHLGGKRGNGWDLSCGDILVILSIVSLVIYSIIICSMYLLYVPILVYYLVRTYYLVGTEENLVQYLILIDILNYT